MASKNWKAPDFSKGLGVKLDIDMLSPAVTTVKQQYAALPEPLREVMPFAGRLGHCGGQRIRGVCSAQRGLQRRQTPLGRQAQLTILVGHAVCWHTNGLCMLLCCSNIFSNICSQHVPYCGFLQEWQPSPALSRARRTTTTCSRLSSATSPCAGTMSSCRSSWHRWMPSGVTWTCGGKLITQRLSHASKFWHPA